MPKSLHSCIIQFMKGIATPIYCVRFFFNKKELLFLGILPHFICFMIYLWFTSQILLKKWVVPLLEIVNLKLNSSLFNWIIHSQITLIFIWIIAILFYGMIGTMLVNVIASPLYDIIAQKSFEAHSTQHLARQNLMDFLNSLISEITKNIFVLCLFVISFFIPIFSSILFLFSIWYIGWNCIDRTLLLMNLSFKQRLAYGIRNFPQCFSLGLWHYIPGFNILFSFVFISSGAIAVAQNNQDEIFIDNDRQIKGVEF